MNNEDTPNGRGGKEPGKEKEPKRPRVTVRSMEIDDLAAVFHMGEKLFTSEALPNLYRTWEEYEVINLYKDDPELCLVAEEEESGAMVGFLLGTTIEKNRSPWKYGYLQWLGVEPSLKGGGIGRRLVNEFVSLIKNTGARMMLVDTEADNYDALQFFKRMGFVNPQQHIYLSLNLSPRGEVAKAKKNGKKKASGEKEKTSEKAAGKNGNGK